MILRPTLVVACAGVVACASTPTPRAAAPLAPVADTSIFAPLRLSPAPGAVRLVTGAPGRKYWQNRADYDLKATLDTAAHVVHGSMVLRYTNNSPDTLRVLWFQTEQDPNERIEQFSQSVNGKLVPVTLENQVSETKVTLARPIKPGTASTFQVAWRFTMNPGVGGRMGREGSLYEVAQWYPRVNVYDDVKGWNVEPYTTGAEFYEDYGDYAMEVTVPAGYIVAATGVLENPRDVLTPGQRARLARAAKADTVVHVVTAAELASGAARPARGGTLTWKFRARNVRDAVWCAAPDYQWDATSWKGILAHAYYRPAAEHWVDAADQARMSIQEYSERWFPYPYPQISVVEGPVGGMEYPMLSMVESARSKPGLYRTVTHEVGHNWFPMIVGSNERVHTWQDEGVNQFVNTFSNARRYPAQGIETEKGDQATRATFYVRWLEQQAASGQDKILETGGVVGNALGQYYKTAGVLQMLRRDVLGPDVFDKGLRTYVRRWAYKHPTPADFFRTMSDVAGRDLDWFWREWFLEIPRFDQSVDSVRQTAQGAETRATVTYGNHGRGVMPLLVRLTFSDGSTQNVTYPADVWRANGATHTESYTFSGKTLARVVVDPDAHLVDVARDNNTWTAAK